MRTLNCLIIEDEHLAADVIKDYITQMPGLRLKAVCDNVFSAQELLRTERVDIIFLDINLPRINGLDFMKTLGSRYHIIITTAYHQYAIDGFNLNATDYLLKPIEFSRFIQAINKVYEKESNVMGHSAPALPGGRCYFFNTDKKKVKVYADDIYYVESRKDYVCIHLQHRKIVTKFQIGEMDKFLDENQFIRIHRSYIINASKVTAYDAAEVELGDISLPLGRTFKEMVERKLKDRPDGIH